MNPEALHKQSIYNKQAVLASSEVGCFQCIRVHPATEVHEWTDAGQTALCPHCGIDSILPGVTDKAVLYAMCELWFTGEDTNNG